MAREPDLQGEPKSVRKPSFENVPKQIAETASETHACHSISACRTAVALARAVVEATAKDHDITSNAQDLWIGSGGRMKGVPSRVNDRQVTE